MQANVSAPPSAAQALEPAITPELVAQHGLKPDEYQRILSLIGRQPSFTELGIFSAMWNEHCSYKSSRLHLKGLPTSAPVRAYVQRVTQLPATQEWIQAALAEQDFLQFEEPYRQQR